MNHEVHVVLPAAAADAARPSGGNAYDRRVGAELTAAGWIVKEHLVGGSWPEPDAATLADLTSALAAVPDGAVVLVDGLLAVPDVVAPAAARVRVVLLVHLPRGDEWMTGARAVITTSEWSAGQLARGGPVRVAAPGADRADLAAGTPGGGELLCVGAVAAHKGQDVLVAALGEVADRPWRCRLVGPLDREPEFVATLRLDLERAGLADRVVLTGPLVGAALADAYAAADLLVLPSRTEAYGMVVTEALARALPVVAARVGGVSEAWGGSSGGPPGTLVTPADPQALAGALRRWLGDPQTRTAWRAAARARREALAGWDATAAVVATVLREAGR